LRKAPLPPTTTTTETPKKTGPHEEYCNVMGIKDNPTLRKMAISKAIIERRKTQLELLEVREEELTLEQQQAIIGLFEKTQLQTV